MRNPIDLAEACLQGIAGAWSRLAACVIALLIGHSLDLAVIAAEMHGERFGASFSHGYGEKESWPFTLAMDWLSGCNHLIGAVHVLLLPACWFFSTWLEWSMANVTVGLIAAQTWQTYLVNGSDWIDIFTDPVGRTFKTMPGLYVLSLMTAASFGMAMGWARRSRD